MPTGDPVPSVPPTHRPQESPLSDVQSESTSQAAKPRTMTPKSSAITARTNYVSPYRQTPTTTRSVSSPIARANAPNAGSPNFKDIVHRFNTKPDEKIPVPTNRIPAVTAGSASLRSRKTPPTRPQGGDSRTPKPRSTSSNGRNKPTSRSNSAQESYTSNSSPKLPTNGRQTRPRRPSTSLSNKSDTAPKNNKSLHPIQTSFNKTKSKDTEHRRSLSALETHSPSAASLADNESDNQELNVKHPLHHRRSHSNIEISNSPITHIQVDPDLSKFSPREGPISPRSPPHGRSGIPISSRAGSSGQRHSSIDQTSQPLKAPQSSSHGSRRPAQPSRSPNLTAYISAPMPKKSPPLRSSRQRLPGVANNSTHASRQRLQHAPSAPGSLKDSRYNRRPEDSRRKEPKRKIPEIGTVDFAARRAQIQSAFTQSLKESDDKTAGGGRRSSSKQSLRDGIEPVEEEKLGIGGRIEEEDEEDEGTKEESEIIAVLPASKVDEQESVVTITHEAKLVESAAPVEPSAPSALDVSATYPIPNGDEEKEEEEAEKAEEDHLSNAEEEHSNNAEEEHLNNAEEDVQEIVRQLRHSMALEAVQLEDIENHETADIDEHPMFRAAEVIDGQHPTHRSPSPHSNQERSEHSIHEGSTEQVIVEESQQPPSRSSSTDVDIPTPLTTAWKRHSMGERLPESRPISVIITPESPTHPTLLSQVSNMLRASPIEWSTDSEMSPDSPILRKPRESIVFNVDPPAPESVKSDKHEEYRMPDHGQLHEQEQEQEQEYQNEREYEHQYENESKPQYEAEALSPLVSTMMSDDRATIASVFDRYDEPREDFLNSYEGPSAETESEHTTCDERDTCDGNETELDDPFHLDDPEPEADTENYTSCSDAPTSSALSIDEQSGDDWVTSSEAEPSPLSMNEDIFNDRNSMERPESPTTPRQTIEAQSPLPPTPPPKDAPPRDSPPPPPEKDQHHSMSNSPLNTAVTPISSSPLNTTVTPTTPATKVGSQGSFLPEIETDSEPLGLAIQALPSHYDFRPGDRPSSYHTEQYYARGSVDRKYSYESSRTSMDQYSTHRPSVDQTSSFHDRYSPSSSFYAEGESRRTSSFAGPNGHRFSETPATSVTTVARASASIHSGDVTLGKDLGKDTQALKLFKRRRHLLMEIVDTESAFFRDMTVAEEIYKGSANACSSITQDDIKVLFGNTDAIVHFSKTFLETLKAAIASVYTMKRNGSGINSSAASVANSINSDERRDGEDPLTEEEKDQKTYVGEAFAEMMYRMEKVYGDYCKNHDNAVTRLGKIENNRGIAIWLQECKACAEDLTNAWNLESLLIKPVQRVLKYPLLLTQLLECTPLSHPDYGPLEIATKEMKFVADRINEMKKRKDMVEKIVGRKRNESDIRHGITKGFARRAEKLRQSVGLSEVVVDEKYNRLFENYHMHFVQVQVIARDVELYVADIQGHVEKFIGFTHNFREYAEIVLTQHVEIEIKWRKFDNAMKEIATTYLQEHKHRVRKHVIEPLETLLKMHESPQVIMTKRNKKAVDYARFKAIKDRGDTPDKKTIELADAYTALNETLIDELPRLFALTKKLVDAVLLNFIDLQAQWMNSWASKIKMTFMELDMPDKIGDVVQAFAGDFSYNEQILKQLAICNGSLKEIQFPSVQFYSSATTLSLEAFDSRRPRTADDRETLSVGGRDRAMSLNSQSPTVANFEKNDTRRHSGGAAMSSPLSAMAPVLPLPPLLAPSNNRQRSSSVAMPAQISSPIKPQPQRSNSSNLPESHSHGSFHRFGVDRSERLGRPHMSRAAATAASLPALSLNRDSRAPSPEPPLPSAAFSSAMPMDDDRASKYSSAMPMDDDRAIETRSHPPSRASSRNASSSRAPSRSGSSKTLTVSGTDKAMFIAASLYEFNIDKQRREAGFPYLTYVQGEIFDVIGVKGEIWLARNQDDKQAEIGWIWCKHFARISEG